MKEDDIISNVKLIDRSEHEEAIRTLYRHPYFPCMMSLNGSIVQNPIYEHLDKATVELIQNDYGPKGLKNFTIMPLDLYLIKGLDKNKQSMLLFYYSGKPKSGWKSFLLPFGNSNKEKDISELILNHETDLEQFLNRESKTVSITKLPNTKYLVSFKMNPGYTELVAYVFTFCYVNIAGEISDIAEKEFEFINGFHTRNFKWYYPEELEYNKKMMELNGDVIRYIHENFETMLNSVTLSFDKPIKLFKHDFALSFAGKDRPIVERIAQKLKEKGFDPFYDDFYKSELVGKNLSNYFKEIYASNTQFVVPFISKNYPNKEWANFEFSIARDESKKRKSEFILPVRLDKTIVFGMSDHTGHIDFETEGVDGTVDILIQKLLK